MKTATVRAISNASSEVDIHQFLGVWEKETAAKTTVQYVKQQTPYF
jgi:hypothetical protein